VAPSPSRTLVCWALVAGAERPGVSPILARTRAHAQQGARATPPPVNALAGRGLVARTRAHA
jgi:hypothetical protein